jgi:alpha,alpha-trehalase
MARFIRAATAALGIVLLSISAQVAGAESEAAYPAPPQQLFADLFVAVQSQAIYPDSKAFPDAVPESTPDDILAQYHALRADSPAALRRFTDAHFELPRDAAAPASPPAQVSIARHIDGLWDALTRSSTSARPFASLLALPYAYVVPGGRFREIYYWDSYFTMLGLDQSGRHDLVEDMVRDFAYLIDRYGHIPNGTRSYYLSRSQPPFFYAMVGLLSADDPAGAYAQYLPQLEREYAFWMDGAGSVPRGRAHRRVVAMADGAILNRYWDDRATPRDESFREDSELARTSERPADDLYRDIRAAAESGWDFSSRWFADARTRASIETTEIVPVDLNSLMFGLENAIHDGCQRRADRLCTRRFARRAAARRAAIDRYLWDRASGAYLDYRWSTGVRLARVSAATFYPLFVRAASGIQARAVAKTATAQLLKAGGIVTSTLETGQQWDAPNGWAPLQWIAIAGLRHYQQAALARTIACRWISIVNDVYRDSGKLVEKYDVVTIGRSGGGGEYPLQDGFGWTNGVMRKLMALYPIEADSTDASQCPAA